MKRSLIAVMTCHGRQYVAKAAAQRATWVQSVSAFADVVFFLGKMPDNDYRHQSEDEVFLDVPDTYDGIPLKVQGIMRWAAARDYYRIMKCDDDVYIAPNRYTALPGGQDYVGRFRGPCGGYPAHFASGFSYWLSKKAAGIIAEQPWNGDWMDERFVANTLAYHKIFGYHDQVNYLVTGPFTRPHELPNRTVLRDGAVFCQYGAADMVQMHAQFALAQPLPQPKLTPVPNVAITATQLAAKPHDQIPPEKNKPYVR